MDFIKRLINRRNRKSADRQKNFNHTIVDWERVINEDPGLWKSAWRQARGGERILMATVVGCHTPLSVIESLIAAALTLRGVEVHVLLCDQVLPACLQTVLQNHPDTEVFRNYQYRFTDECANCVSDGLDYFGPLDIKIHYYSDFLDARARANCRALAEKIPLVEIPVYRNRGMSIGEHAYAGALRFYASGNLDREEGSELMVRRYFEGALLTQVVTERIIKKYGFSMACFNHGIYNPHGIIGEVCRDLGTRVINWNISYRKKTLIFSHEDTYHHTMLDEPVDTWENLVWGREREREILDYLAGRRYGTEDWIWFIPEPEEDTRKIASETGIDFTRPVIGMLSNVIWDAQLHYRTNIFPGMLSWVIETIEYFREREDLQLLLRIHPAEVNAGLKARQKLIDEIRDRFETIPRNVFIVPPESGISTYTAMEQCDSVIIYGTKTGVELACMGIPVIVAGEAWVKNKGLTTDPVSREEYFRILDSLPRGRRMEGKAIERARRYAYHFFFRRMIPLEILEEKGHWPPFIINIRSMADILPGKDPGLDVICEGIMRGTPFIFRAEDSGPEK